MKHADRLASAMTRAAIELASLVGLPGEPDEDRILDTGQVPCAAWNAAKQALDTLMIGMAVIDSCRAGLEAMKPSAKTPALPRESF